MKYRPRKRLRGFSFPYPEGEGKGEAKYFKVIYAKEDKLNLYNHRK